jgi:hypothetical protein
MFDLELFGPRHSIGAGLAHQTEVDMGLVDDLCTRRLSLVGSSAAAKIRRHTVWVDRLVRPSVDAKEDNRLATFQ